MNNRSITANLLSEKVGITRKNADWIFVSVVDVIREQLEKHGEVLLPGFGRMKTMTRKGRAGRNPKTGEAIQIPERTVAKFKRFGK